MRPQSLAHKLLLAVVARLEPLANEIEGLKVEKFWTFAPTGMPFLNVKLVNMPRQEHDSPDSEQLVLEFVVDCDVEVEEGEDLAAALDQVFVAVYEVLYEAPINYGGLVWQVLYVTNEWDVFEKDDKGGGMMSIVFEASIGIEEGKPGVVG